MGMFDYFVCDVSCPVCGNYVNNPFQTKDMDRLMDVYEPGDKVSRKLKSIRVYTTCDHEKTVEKFDGSMVFLKINAIWIEYEIPVEKDGTIVRDQNQWIRRYEPTDFDGLSFIPEGMTKEQVLLALVARNAKIRKDIEITKSFKT